MNTYFFKKFILALFLLLGLTSNAYSITIIPAIAKIEGTPGEIKAHNINFINDSKLTCSINVKASGIDFNKRGNRVFDDKRNIVKNITLSPVNFILKPGENKNVTLNIKIPDNLQGSDDSMIFFTASPIFVDKSGKVAKMLIDTSLGSLIMIYSKGTEIFKSRIKKADIFQTKKKSISTNLEVINQGNCHIEGSGNVAIFDKSDNFITSFNIPKIIVYPGQSAIMTGELKKRLNNGEYHALITYQYNTDKNIVIDKPFEIK